MNTTDTLNEIFVNAYRISTDKIVLTEEERWTARESLLCLLSALSKGAENDEKYQKLHYEIRKELG